MCKNKSYKHILQISRNILVFFGVIVWLYICNLRRLKSFLNRYIYNVLLYIKKNFLGGFFATCRRPWQTFWRLSHLSSAINLHFSPSPTTWLFNCHVVRGQNITRGAPLTKKIPRNRPPSPPNRLTLKWRSGNRWYRQISSVYFVLATVWLCVSLIRTDQW